MAGPNCLGVTTLMQRHITYITYMKPIGLYTLITQHHVLYGYLLGYLIGVASKQLRLLHGRVGDSTIVVKSLSPQMSELVEDAIAS